MSNNPPATLAQPVKSITESEKCYMLSAMLHFPDLFSVAKEKLLPEYFNPEEVQYAVYWRMVLETAAKNGGRLPTEGLQNLIYVAVSSYAESEIKHSNPSLYAQFFVTGGFLHQAVAGYRKDSMNRQLSFNLLQKFLQERKIFKRLAMLASQGNSTETVQNIRLLNEEATRVEGLGITDIHQASHARSDKPGIHLFPTGVEYIDYRLGGGVTAGKVYGLLGPTGVGKTLNFVKLMVSTAVQEQIRYNSTLDANGASTSKLGKYYYFVYEGGKEEIQRRCMAYLSMIPLDRLTKYELDPTMNLAGPSDPRPDYEAKYFPDGVGPYGEQLLSEVERYATANNILSKNVYVCEMMPSLENPKKGCGYVQEIQNILLSQKEDGHDVAGYYIDYAKIAAKNYCGNKLDHIRHLVGGMPMECIRHLNSYLPRAHGWIANQFNTEANRKAPTWVPSHTYAAEAGDFGDNCWFTFCLGTRSQDDNCCLINCSKHRDFHPTPPSILYIHGSLNRMICMDGEIDLDKAMGNFVHHHNHQRDDRGTLIVPFRRKTA